MNLEAINPFFIVDDFQVAVSYVSGLSRVDVGLWRFEVEDADGYVLCFARPDDT